MRRILLHRILGWLTVLSVLCSHTLEAQTVKSVTVAQNQSFTDHIALASDSRDLDLMVKLVFNEPENTLTVSLVSYRNLFVFQDDIRYAQAIRGRRLCPERLPYVVQADQKMKFLLDKPLKASLQRPRKKVLFRRWIAYENLQPQPTEYKMINDYIEQKFDIVKKSNHVQVTLRDIFVMEPHLRKPEYRLVCQKDVNTTYEITILRDPCFNKEEELTELAAKVEAVSTGYQTLVAKFSGDPAQNTPEIVSLFNETQQLLLQQFPRLQSDSRCEQIQQQVQTYNSYLDSIQMKTCYYLPPEAPVSSPVVQEMVVLEISAEQIRAMARQIDNCVGRWLLTTDRAEKQDLEEYCIQTIAQLNEQLEEADTISPQQEAAIAIFRRAEQHFQSSCKYE